MRRKKAAEPVPPCEHPDAWVPEAIVFGGTLPEAKADVVCFSCGWQGRVPLSAMPEGTRSA